MRINWLLALLPIVFAASAPTLSTNKNPAWSRALKEHGEDIAHLAIAVYCSRHAVMSVRSDEWAAIRRAPPSSDGRGRIFRKRRRAAKMGQLIGAGYTPRIVFLAGLMMRSLQMTTRLQQIFDPSLGYAAGATLGATFSQREWIPCILLGWGVGGACGSTASPESPHFLHDISLFYVVKSALARLSRPQTGASSESAHLAWIAYLSGFSDGRDLLATSRTGVQQSSCGHSTLASHT